MSATADLAQGFGIFLVSEEVMCIFDGSLAEEEPVVQYALVGRSFNRRAKLVTIAAKRGIL